MVSSIAGVGSWPRDLSIDRFSSLPSPSTSAIPRASKFPERGQEESHVACIAFPAYPRWSSQSLSFRPTKFGRRGRLLISSDSGGSASRRTNLLHAGDKPQYESCMKTNRVLGIALLYGFHSRGLSFCSVTGGLENRNHIRSKTVIRRAGVNAAASDNEYCDRSDNQPHGACSFRRSSSPSTREGSSYVEVPQGSDPDQSGYTIKVSKELMGVFRYVEKVKRARIKELANTLRQTAAACMFFSCVRGIVSPVVEVFQTRPPSWGKLILMLSAFDSFAITYLALKASEPLEKLSMLASESEKDIMGSIEKEEEHMLALAVELVKLFRRLRNITVCTALAQFGSLAHSLLRMNNPKLVENLAKIISVWIRSPWN